MFGSTSRREVEPDFRSEVRERCAAAELDPLGFRCAKVDIRGATAVVRVGGEEPFAGTVTNERQAAIHRDRAFRLYSECRMVEAVEELKTSVNHSPRDAKAWHLYLEGNVYSQKGERDRARDCFQRALERMPKHPHARRELEALGD